MTTLHSERSWLLDRSTLKLVQQCCRMIESEFGIRLHLTEEHLEQQLAAYVRKSQNRELAGIWQSLLEQVPELEEKTEEHPRKMYRGQVIADDRPASHSGEGNEEEHQPRKKKIIYRGQVIG